MDPPSWIRWNRKIPQNPNIHMEIASKTRRMHLSSMISGQAFAWKNPDILSSVNHRFSMANPHCGYPLPFACPFAGTLATQPTEGSEGSWGRAGHSKRNIPSRFDTSPLLKNVRSLIIWYCIFFFSDSLVSSLGKCTVSDVWRTRPSRCYCWSLLWHFITMMYLI